MDELALFESLRPNESALSDADRVALRASLFAGFEGGDGDGDGPFRDPLAGSTTVTLIDSVRTPIQPERRHRWPVIAVAAAAVVAVVVAGLVIATRTDDPTGEVPADQPTTVAWTTVERRRETGAFEDGPGVTYIVPDGWEGDSGGVVKGDRAIGVMFLSAEDQFYTRTSCQSELGDGPVGPTITDLVSAWANLPGVDATSPRDLTIDGFDAKQFEFTFPDFGGEAACNGIYFRCSYAEDLTRPVRCSNLLWNGPRTVPNQHQEIWVLNVDGARLMIMAWSPPNASQQDRAAIDEIVASIHIG